MEVTPMYEAPVMIQLPDGSVVQGVPVGGGVPKGPPKGKDKGKGMMMGKGMGKGKGKVAPMAGGRPEPRGSQRFVEAEQHREGP